MIRNLSIKVKKVWAEIALLSITTIIVIVVFMISLTAFILIAREVFILKDERFDYRVFDYLLTHVNQRNNAIMQAFTFLGTHIFLIPANLVLIAYYVFIRKHRWNSIRIPTIAISSVALMFLLKNLFGRHRPNIPLLKEASGLSFPSGHAFMSVTFYGLLIYIIWRTAKNKWLKWSLSILLFFLIIIIGFTRIYLRVHYPSDVLAGFATGFLWLVISVWTLGRIEKYSNRKIDPVVRSKSVTSG